MSNRLKHDCSSAFTVARCTLTPQTDRVHAVYSFVLLVNVAGAFAYLIVASQHGTAGYAGTTFGVSILHLVVASPCSFVCWYRPLYKAFRSV